MLKTNFITWCSKSSHHEACWWPGGRSSATFNIPWRHHQMETFSVLLALFAGNSLVTSEFPLQRPVMQSFDVFFDLHRNKRLSKQLKCGWFEIPLHSLWRHCNATNTYQDHPNKMRWFIAVLSIRELPTCLGHCQHYIICSVIQMVHIDAPDKCNNTPNGGCWCLGTHITRHL